MNDRLCPTHRSGAITWARTTPSTWVSVGAPYIDGAGRPIKYAVREWRGAGRLTIADRHGNPLETRWAGTPNEAMLRAEDHLDAQRAHREALGVAQ